MRKILLCAALGFLAMGCSDNKTIDYAALAAKEYYDSLMAVSYTPLPLPTILRV